MSDEDSDVDRQHVSVLECRHRDNTLREAPGGGPLDFDNISDSLVARLFINDSPDACIPWKYCELILSTINDIRFNSKDVTFKNGGDMFSRMGQHRSEAWSVVEARSKKTTIPQVALEGVFNIMEMEMQHGVDIELGKSRGHSLDPSDVRTTLRGVWRDTLWRMALVHSSWLAYARRLLGYRVVSKGPAPNALRSPLFGAWTKELYLSYGSLSVGKSSIAPNQPQSYFLKAFCARIPNVRLVSLSLPSVSKHTNGFITTLCEALSVLTVLEDLTLHSENFFFPSRGRRTHDITRLIDALSKTRHPSLRCLHFNLRYLRDSPKIIRQHDLPSPLASLPKLCSVCFSFQDCSNVGPPVVSGVSWLRAVFESEFAFSVDELRFDCPFTSNEEIVGGGNTDVENTEVQEMLRVARRVEFRMDSPNPKDVLLKEDTPANLVATMAAILNRCTSARKLVFSGLLWTRISILGQLRAQLDAPKSVEDIVIITHLPDPPRDPYVWKYHPTAADEQTARLQISVNDGELSKALALGIAPGLRRLKVYFAKRWLSQTFFDEHGKSNDCRESNSAGEYYRFLLSCRVRCIEMDIQFYVGPAWE